jgi:cyclohexa-1,5-dienecarbonyl-CoA hydratase
MTFEAIECRERFEGQVVEIVLGPPPGNILTSRLLDELSTALEEADGDPRRKLVVITGQGKHFCFGASVEEHAPDSVGDMLPRFHRTIGAVVACPVPTLAKVTGACLGGGFELAMACGLVFCDDTASFGLPEIQLGVFPPPASILLRSRCSDGAAYELIVTGDKVEGARAHELGIVNSLHPKEALDSATDAFIEKEILPKSASSLRIASTAARMLTRHEYEGHIDAIETLYLKTLMSTDDAVEGIRAFQEKRPPQWKDA